MFATYNISIAVIIFFARVCDVGLGTLRQSMIIRGGRRYAFLIAFFESLIWIFAVSRVMSTINDPLTSIAFALGFASGTFAGMTIEGFLKIGDQVIRIFSRSGERIAEELRKNDYRATVFDGSGRDGPVKLLFIQSKRKRVPKVIALARKTDPCCYIIIDDIRSADVNGNAKRTKESLSSAAPVITADNK